jgi:RNA polymerase sigma-70 factor (ECF subfamily)
VPNHSEQTPRGFVYIGENKQETNEPNAETGAQKVIAVSNADTALVIRCQANDAAAFNEIVARYKNKIYNYICRMVGAGPDAEDLTQETFVRAYMHIKSFQSRASLNTWLFRIATNVCIDFSRKQARGIAVTDSFHSEKAEDKAEKDVPDTRFDPPAILLNKELMAHLHHALQTLPDKLRTVVLLHDVEGLAYEEIAEVVDCPLGTVKSRLFNARKALRTQLLPYLDGSLGMLTDGKP